ncbi:MAG: PspC domain-containing protein [Candidatus Saccharimonadales bacterium]
MKTQATNNQKSDIKRLYLSQTDKKICGLCGGIGEYFEIDTSLVRLGWIVLTIMTGILPGIIAYFIAAIVIPKE